jgi:protease-4
MIRERSVEPYLGLLKGLKQRKRVRGVLLDISSGGGEVVPSVDFYLAVKRLDAVKPVVATIGSIGASGAYMVAVGARKVFAYPDSYVGSIGVVHPHIAVEKLLAKIGVEVDLIHQGRHKDAYQMIRPLTEEEREKLLAVTGDAYSSFVELVARERRRTVEQILPLATGEAWSGKKAIQLGLIDALGDREAALEELGRLTGVSTRKVVRAVPPRPFLQQMLSGAASAFAPGLVQGLQDSVEDAMFEAAVRQAK